MTAKILQLGYVLTPLFFFFAAFGEVLPRQGQFVFMLCVGIAGLASLSANRWVRYFSWYCVAWILFSHVYAMTHADQPMFIAAATQIRGFTRYIVIGLALYVLIAKTDVETESWFNWICIGAIVQSVIAIPNHFDIYLDDRFRALVGIPYVNEYRYIVGTMENANFFACYLAISVPFFLRRNWFYFLPVIAVHMAFMQTATAVVAAAAGVAVWVGSWHALWPLGAAIAFVLYDGSLFNSDRWEYWKLALHNYNNHPFAYAFGHGPFANWGKPFNLHNEYLQFAFEFGATGMLLIGAYIGTIYRANKVLFAAFVAGAVACIGAYPWHVPPSAFLMIVIMALIEKESNEHQHDNR